jgi:transposase-like protein
LSCESRPTRGRARPEVRAIGRSHSQLGEPGRPGRRSWEDGFTTEEKEEVRRLRRENKILREEREILRKAAAWFAKETTSIPSRDSSS